MINIGHNKKRRSVYEHRYLDMQEVERIKPLIESAFAPELARYNMTPEMRDQKVQFMAEQYANRKRVSKGSPLMEDADIFGHLSRGLRKLFEDASMPTNIAPIGNVSNAAVPSAYPNGGTMASDYQTGSGDLPTYVFGLQGQLAINSIAFDFLPSISVDTPKPMCTYYDTVYGGGAFTDPKNYPSYVELSGDTIDFKFVDTNELERAKSELVLSGATNVALKFRYITNTQTGGIIVEMLDSGTWSVDQNLEGSYDWTVDTVSIKAVQDDINANGGKLFTPAFAASVAVTKTKIDFASATRNTISEASTVNGIGAMSRDEHDTNAPKYKLNIIALEKQYDIVGREIEADTTNIQIKDFDAIGIDAISLLYEGVQNHLVHDLDSDILDHLYKMGVTHAVRAYKSQGESMNLYIGVPGNPSYPMANVKSPLMTIDKVDGKTVLPNIVNSLATTTNENQDLHAGRLYKRISYVKDFMLRQNRTGEPDICVVSTKISATLKAHANYTINPVASNFTGVDIAMKGTVDGMAVYVNNKIPASDPRILLIRRGNDTDTGCKLLVYDLAQSRQTVAESTMSDKIRAWSRYQIADIGHHPELNYFVFLAYNDFSWV